MKHNQRYQVITAGSRLWGHNLGRRVRAEIEALLDTVPNGNVLIIDLTDVEVMDFSFASEVFGKLYAALSTAVQGRAVVLFNLSEYVQENLSAALSAMGLMALTMSSVGGWQLIGKVNESDSETLTVIAQRRQVTAPDVAAALNIKLTTCNQRLRKLVEAGALIRTKLIASTGGEQYQYTWPL